MARHKQLRVGDRLLTLKAIRPGKVPVARFGEILDRDQAEALRGSLVTVPRSALPPLEDGEYYHADLIGLPCRDSAGTSLGTVAAVENFGAGDILEIERPDGRRTMVPFRDGIADLVEDGILVDPQFLT